MSNDTESLKTSIEFEGSTTVLIAVGRLDFDAAAGFQRAIEQAVAGGGTAPKAVVIDCAKLDYVSSAGLRSFLVGARAAKSASVAFSVCSLSASVREVFTVSGFNRLITEHADRAAALAAG